MLPAVCLLSAIVLIHCQALKFELRIVSSEKRDRPEQDNWPAGNSIVSFMDIDMALSLRHMSIIEMPLSKAKR